MKINGTNGPLPGQNFLLRVQVDADNAVRTFGGVIFVERLFNGHKQRLPLGIKQQAVWIHGDIPLFFQRIGSAIEADNLASTASESPRSSCLITLPL